MPVRVRNIRAQYAPSTLAIDVGGTALKASVLDTQGCMLVENLRMQTPHPCDPETLLSTLADLVAPLPPYDRISMGFPGVVRDGYILTAPHFEGRQWHRFEMEAVLSHRFGKPSRLLNDAEVHGLGIINGSGLEVVLTLGTGIGSAVFSNGRLTPHLELGHHPIHNGKTYDEYIGNKARLRR
jgi:polyphosphate glucokinase